MNARLQVVNTSSVPRSAKDLTQDIASVERSRAVLLRERSQRQQERQDLLIEPAPDQLTIARSLHDEIKEFDAQIELLDAKRDALGIALEQARQREREASWVQDRKNSESAANRYRADMQALQRGIDNLVPLMVACAKSEDAWTQTLRPANVPCPALLSPLLGRLANVREHMLTNGRIRAQGLLENAFELRESRRADLLWHLDNLLVPTMRCFDAPAPSRATAPPDEAA